MIGKSRKIFSFKLLSLSATKFSSFFQFIFLLQTDNRQHFLCRSIMVRNSSDYFSRSDGKLIFLRCGFEKNSCTSSRPKLCDFKSKGSFLVVRSHSYCSTRWNENIKLIRFYFVERFCFILIYSSSFSKFLILICRRYSWIN